MQNTGGWRWSTLTIALILLIEIFSIILGWPNINTVAKIFFKMLIPVLGLSSLSPVGFAPPQKPYFKWLATNYGVSVQFNLPLLFITVILTIATVAFEQIIQ